MIAFATPGILQIIAAIIRGTEKGGTWQAVVISVVVVNVVWAPYVYYTLIKHEEASKGAWWNSANGSTQIQGEGSS